MSRLRPSGQTPFRTPGHRFAVAVCPTGNLTDGDQLAVTVADPDGHPFDLGPTALLDRVRVQELQAALGEWLAGTRG